MEKIITPDAFAIAPVHGRAGHAHFVGPFGQRHGAAIVFMVKVAATICALVLGHAPNAVFWTVRAIVVNALNRVPGRWTLAHVIDEVFKGQPTLAHGNASRAVVLEVLGSRICAAVDHAGPNLMFARARRAMCAQSLRIAPAQLLPTDAAAGQATTVQKVCSSNLLGLSAVTHADPSRATARCVLASMQNGESAKNLARQIVSFNHNQHCIASL